MVWCTAQSHRAWPGCSATQQVFPHAKQCVQTHPLVCTSLNFTLGSRCTRGPGRGCAHAAACFQASICVSVEHCCRGAHGQGRHGRQRLVLPLAKQAGHAGHYRQAGDGVRRSTSCHCCRCSSSCCCRCQCLLLACELGRRRLAAVEDLLALQGQLPVPAVHSCRADGMRRTTSLSSSK